MIGPKERENLRRFFRECRRREQQAKQAQKTWKAQRVYIGYQDEERHSKENPQDAGNDCSRRATTKIPACPAEREKAKRYRGSAAASEAGRTPGRTESA